MKNLIEEFKILTNIPKEYSELKKSLFNEDSYPESKYEICLTKLESWISKKENLIKEEMSKIAKDEGEKMYREFLDRDCNDLLVILVGRIQVAILKDN